jgi:hypothetical protein
VSLDIYLEQPGIVTVFDTNYTHNVTPMWRKAGCYDALYMSEGKSAAEVLPALRAALYAMQSDSDGYRALDAPNKWGTYETALPWLERLVAAFEENPNATIRVSK